MNTPSDELVTRLRKMAKCIYIAVEEPVANDISGGLTEAAQEIERLRARLRETRDAIATLDDDAFGHANMPDRWTGAAMAYSVRDELLTKIDAALSSSGEGV